MAFVTKACGWSRDCTGHGLHRAQAPACACRGPHVGRSTGWWNSSRGGSGPNGGDEWRAGAWDILCWRLGWTARLPCHAARSPSSHVAPDKCVWRRGSCHSTIGPTFSLFSLPTATAAQPSYIVPSSISSCTVTWPGRLDADADNADNAGNAANAAHAAFDVQWLRDTLESRGTTLAGADMPAFQRTTTTVCQAPVRRCHADAKW